MAQAIGRPRGARKLLVTTWSSTPAPIMIGRGPEVLMFEETRRRSDGILSKYALV